LVGGLAEFGFTFSLLGDIPECADRPVELLAIVRKDAHMIFADDWVAFAGVDRHFECYRFRAIAR